jgi:glycosyltransferase involved in cell wall biosynthesis
MEDGRTAILIPPGDVDALCEALQWVIEHPEDAKQMGEQGCDHVLQEFSVEKVIPAYEACYEAVIREER